MNHLSLPDLNEEYLLTNEQIQSFREEGHIYLPQVATNDEVQAYRPLVQEATRNYYSYENLTEPLVFGDSFVSNSLIAITNLWIKTTYMRKFVLAKRFAKIAAELLGVQGVRLYYDVALFKKPGGIPTQIHIDQYNVDSDKIITMWMPLVDIKEGLTSLTYFSGSHRLSKDLPPSKAITQAIRQRLPQINYGEMLAGDATFHMGRIIHSAPGNSTDRMREVMTIVFFADGCNFFEPGNDTDRIIHYQRHFPGQTPWQEINNNLNPLIYRK